MRRRQEERRKKKGTEEAEREEKWQQLKRKRLSVKDLPAKEKDEGRDH